MMQSYNSMLSSSIILIFPSELIIHTDNLMIFLGDSRRVETMYVLFSYLIWKMATNINIHYPECSRHPTLVLVGRSGSFPFLTEINYSSWRGQPGGSKAWLQCGYFELCSEVAALWHALLRSHSAQQELLLLPRCAGCTGAALLQHHCSARAWRLTCGFNWWFHFLAKGNFVNNFSRSDNK